jgi:magnesium chelatase family protein
VVTKIISGAVAGISGYLVTVETDLSPGLPSFDVVGLPDSAVKEARERVRAAVKNAGFDFPVKRITVNLAPAATKKEGSAFDLPIALGVLAGCGVIKAEALRDALFLGELSLDGEIKPVSGVLPIIHGAFQAGVDSFIVPMKNGEEAALVAGAAVYAAPDLSVLVNLLKTGNLEKIRRENTEKQRGAQDEEEFAGVRGQDSLKRAFLVAAAGAHNLIMSGPPGSGKTMMAKRMPGILPPLGFEESMEVTKIYSVAGLLDGAGSLMRKSPFRAPHHTSPYSAVTGGGGYPRPGEISLAHNGVLFLDELPEFHRDVLEALRQPLEDGFITVTRTKAKLVYPADFMLLAAMNPCPCGYLGNLDKCRCTPAEVARYQRKISGPLLDRIDIQIDVSPVKYNELAEAQEKERAKPVSMRERVIRARAVQKERYKGRGAALNSRLGAEGVEKYCRLDAAGRDMLRMAFDSLGLSARAYHKILKVARTVADLDEAENISVRHVAEAISYRSLDRRISGQ